MRNSARIKLLILALLTAAQLPAHAASTELHDLSFAKGSRARIYGADYVLEHFVLWQDNDPWLQMPGAPAVELDCPSSLGGSSDWERFFPHSQDDVVDALRQVDYPHPVDEIEIIILPWPRRWMPESSACGRRIYLSPGISQVPAAVTHMITVHELGHLFHFEHLPDADLSLWSELRQLRGIEDEGLYHAAAQHCNRPHEILAEDFRFLFGGELANYSGSIENHTLPLPDQVLGYTDFLLRLSTDQLASVSLAAANFPNPFNPDTRLRLTADASLVGRDLSVGVYDVRGRLVRQLYNGTLFSHSLSFPWDGDDDEGRPLPSGVYFSRFHVAGQTLTHKMIMVE